MKEKLCGITASLSIIVCFFCLTVAAQKNGQLLLKKENAALAQAVLEEINAARANPQQFVTYLEEYRKLFNGSKVRNSRAEQLMTFEGIAVVDEAIGFLRKLQPLERLQTAEGLIKAADLQLADLILNPSLGHTGADGSSFVERIRKFGTTKGMLGENIAYKTRTAREIVLLWVIDDGVSSRLHRKNLFSPDFKKVGIAYGKAEDDTELCVLVLAADFIEKGQIKPIEIF